MFRSVVRELSWLSSILLLAALRPTPLVSQQEAVAHDLTFEDRTTQAGISFTHVHGGTGEKYMVETMGGGAASFDYNNDGFLDLYLVTGGLLPGFTSPTTPRNALYKNNGDGTFTDVTEKAGIGNPLWSASCAFADVDQDGDLDLFVVNYVEFSLDNHQFCGDKRTKVRAYCSPQVYNGLPNILYRNNGDRTFTEITKEAGLYTMEGKGLGVVFGDYDHDGDIDILIMNSNSPPTLLRNDGGNRGHWLMVKAIGTTSNRDGIGARIRVVAGPSVQIREIRGGGSYLSQNDPRAHLGLGTFGKVDLLEIRWPSGIVDRIRDIEADQLITVREGQGVANGQGPRR